MTSITLSSASAHYQKKPCLKNVDLMIEPTQTWAILGPNGSGKSALGRLITNQLRPNSGTCHLPDKSAFVSFEAVSEALEQERYNDDSDICGGADQGTLARDFILGNRQSQEDELLKLAEQLKFTHILDRGIKFLSTGEMRKVLICRSLLQKPSYLVLDEPFDGLDANSKLSLERLIGVIINNGTNIILLLNRFSEVLPEVTHIAYMQKGAIMLSGPKTEALDSPALHRLLALHNSTPTPLPEKIYPRENNLTTSPIVMHNVNVSYAGKKILSNLNWEVKLGEHWIVAGPNGSGKTTLLNLISGDNTQAYANNIKLFGQQKGSGETIWDLKKKIGIISTAFQRNYRVSGTALSVVVSGFYDSIGVYRKVSKAEKNIAMDWLNLIRMTDLANKPFQTLSFGEQRLALLARAMIKHPELLILDEPCQGLDEINREMILKVIDILAAKDDTQILYVTHQPEDHISCINNLLQLVPAAEGGFTAKIEKY